MPNHSGELVERALRIADDEGCLDSGIIRELAAALSRAEAGREEAMEQLAAKEEKRAMWDRLAHEHQASGQAFWEELQWVRGEVEAISLVSDPYEIGERIAALQARLSRDAKAEEL